MPQVKLVPDHCLHETHVVSCDQEQEVTRRKLSGLWTTECCFLTDEGDTLDNLLSDVLNTGVAFYFLVSSFKVLESQQAESILRVANASHVIILRRHTLT